MVERGIVAADVEDIVDTAHNVRLAEGVTPVEAVMEAGIVIVNTVFDWDSVTDVRLAEAVISGEAMGDIVVMDDADVDINVISLGSIIELL